MIQECMTEHETVFQLLAARPADDGKAQSLLFGLPQIRLDEAGLRRNLLNAQRPTVFQHIARFHNK